MIFSVRPFSTSTISGVIESTIILKTPRLRVSASNRRPLISRSRFPLQHPFQNIVLSHLVAFGVEVQKDTVTQYGSVNRADVFVAHVVASPHQAPRRSEEHTSE